MRTGDEQRTALRDERFVDVGFGDGHVGTVLAHEDQRKRVLVLDAEHHRAGEPVRVGADVAHVTAFTCDGLDEKAAVAVVAHARNQCRLETEAGAAERRVGG